MQMCGIAGILLDRHAASEGMHLEDIRGLIDTLRHRGPDGEGIWLDRPAGIALGHRRLAILDLSPRGHQPMCSRSGRFVITFNGEIYNYRDIRDELQKLGHRFEGGSDTEVLLAAVESWGLETALQRSNGMFALGLWDRHSNTLQLARDRMGKKPLYVARVGKALVFGSELKCIRNMPGFEAELSPSAVGSLLSYGWIPEDECIWRNAFKLAPGGILTICAQDLQRAGGIDALRSQVRKWWSLAEVAAQAERNRLSGRSAEEVVALLDEILRAAVKERMVADVPVGAFLSGGIDSSTVVALMQCQSHVPARTFTIGFEPS